MQVPEDFVVCTCEDDSIFTVELDGYKMGFRVLFLGLRWSHTEPTLRELPFPIEGSAMDVW